MKIVTACRITGFCCAAVLLYLGVGFFQMGAKNAREVEAAKSAIRVRMPIDLSKPGEYRAALHETFLNSHGSAIEIETTPPFENEAELEKALTGVKGKFAVVAEDGDILWDKDFSDYLFSSQKANAAGKATWSPTLSYQARGTGEFQLIVNVTAPAAGMAGRTQEVVGTYQLCGMEELPAKVGYFFGGVLTLASVMAGAISWRWGRKRDWRG